MDSVGHRGQQHEALSERWHTLNQHWHTFPIQRCYNANVKKCREARETASFCYAEAARREVHRYAEVERG